MPPKLVAIDLDGTLIGPDLAIADDDARAISQAVAAGATICLATGRLFSAARPFARAIAENGPLIALNGAAVYDLVSGALLTGTPLARATAQRAYDWMKAAGFHVQLYFDDRLYLDALNERARLYLNLSRVKPVLVSDLRTLLTDDPMKVLGVGDEALVAESIRPLAAHLDNSASVFRSQRMFLEVTNPAASKGGALRWIAAKLDVQTEDIIAVGDSDNDVSMFAVAGISFAVQDGTPAALEAATHVVAPRAAGGVAQALEMAFDELARGRS